MEDHSDHPISARELNALKWKITNLERQVGSLKQQLQSETEKHQISEKAFRVIGFEGNYVEFGAYRGESLVQAYYSGLRVATELQGGRWDHSYSNPAESHKIVRDMWDRLRFFAFDSFQGMPASTGVDAELEIFPEGTYRAPLDDFWATLDKFSVPKGKVVPVEGFFQDTCVPEVARKIGLAPISIVHIDSDLYESAKIALEFVTPYLMPSAVIIFDEWYQFFGNPRFGEHRAFREWKDAHPEWEVVDFQKEGAYRNSFLVHRRE
jgi:hypothetical protein